MDGKQAPYTYEQKVAAARAVIEDGMIKAEAMAEFKIMSLAPLKLWCRLEAEVAYLKKLRALVEKDEL